MNESFDQWLTGSQVAEKAIAKGFPSVAELLLTPEAKRRKRGLTIDFSSVKRRFAVQPEEQSNRLFLFPSRHSFHHAIRTTGCQECDTPVKKSSIKPDPAMPGWGY